MTKKILLFLILLSPLAAYTSSLPKASHEDWKQLLMQDTLTLYAPVSLSTFKKTLKLTISPETTIAASALHHQDHLALVVNQGLLDSPRLTPDILRMVLCHELGHLFGGAPRRNIPPEWDGPVATDGQSFHSAEGQSDYYASVVCFRRLVRMRPNMQTSIKRAGPRLTARCDQAWTDAKERALCLRTALAGQDFLNLVFEFPISTENTDSSISPVLIRDTYPSRQCRLDTIINGALCSETFSSALNFSQMEKNDCSFQEAKRPLCWYHQ